MNAPHRSICTDCGISRTSNPKACATACQFIAPDYATMERAVHGRARDPARPDELHFGTFRRMIRASLKSPRPGAQWTGITTRLAELLLERNEVDAIVTVAPHPNDRWRPVPTLITNPAELALCRGMRMGYAPTLALLEEAQRRGLRRLAVIGIPCQIHALRRLQSTLGLERLFVIGTPCSDNTTPENFAKFLALLTPTPEQVTYLEFRADYRVELRFQNGRTRLIPFLQLPLSNLPPDFFPLACRTCVDYTNALADITIGYMAGTGRQWILIRNDRGAHLHALIAPELAEGPCEDRGSRRAAVIGFIENTRRAAGGLPLRRMPGWARRVVGFLQPRVGPRGLEFARARLEMKAAETVLHLRRTHPARLKHMVPPHVWALLKPYGITPAPGEHPIPGAIAPALPRTDQ